MERRRWIRRALSILFALFSLDALAQVVLAVISRSDDPRTLTVLQLLRGISAGAAAWSTWTGRRWSPVAAVVFGVTTATMLAALPFLLALEPQARPGIWSGAAGALLGSIAAAWYLRRSLSSTSMGTSASQTK